MSERITVKTIKAPRDGGPIQARGSVRLLGRCDFLRFEIAVWFDDPIRFFSVRAYDANQTTVFYERGGNILVHATDDGVREAVRHLRHNIRVRV